MRWSSSRLRDDAGVTTVEFALVLPIFVFLIGIAFYFSWLFYVQAQVDSAADRAARYAAVPYVTTQTVSKNVDINGNISAGGANVSTGATIVGAYQTNVTTTTYHFCETEVVNKINQDLIADTIPVPTPATSPAVDDPSSYDVQVSDGTTVAPSATPNPSHVAGPIPVTQSCQKPLGYVKVKITKDFTNPFSWIIAPFTGTTSVMHITGTGRARVESP